MSVFDELLGQGVGEAGQQTGKIFGIITGLVKENWDSEHPGMVKVEYFLGEQGKNQTGWVPVATPYGGKEFGFYALPEVGSEVILAFLMGNRNCPIVIGSVWNKENPLPKETALEKNTVKKLRTKGGCEILFSEESGKEQIQIQTPKGLNILLEDEKEVIQISDKDQKNGVQIDTKNGAMVLMADKTIELKAGGNTMASFDGKGKAVNLKGGKIVCNADQGVEVKSQTIKMEGNASVEIKGTGSLKVESSGVATIKGSMVQIN